MKPTIVIVPGYTNAGPTHWQSLLQNKYSNVIRCNQDDWESPDANIWVHGLNDTLSKISGNIILVGHSCGSVTIAQWAQLHNSSKVIGALLVAPADVDSPSAIEPIRKQRPLPMAALPFPSTLVCSDNDEHITLDRSKELAECWGSSLILVPGAGHIHTAAGYGEWRKCEEYITALAGEPPFVSL